ncbi:MAG TPA: hypothetical protein VLZ83_16855 [Edaphocola sp.]|nr:hypothetical protein [Edaphocola sp.]
MKIFFLIFLLLLSFNTYSQEYILRLGIKDCINCNIYIVKMKEFLKDKKLTIILPLDYEEDSVLIADKFLLNDLNYSFDFSNKHFYSYEGVKSYFSIINDGKLVYNCLLSDVNFDFLNNSISLKICLNNSRNYNSLVFINNSMVLRNPTIGKYLEYNLDSNKTHVFFPNEKFAMLNYKNLYKNNWESWYKLYQKYAAIIPSINTENIDLNIDSEGNVMILSSSRIFIPTPNSEDTLAVSQLFLISNILDSNKMQSTYFETNQLPKNYSLYGQFFFHEKDVVIPIIFNKDYNNEVKILCRYSFDKVNNKLVFKELLPFKIPPVYVKYDLDYNFNSYLKHESLLIMNFANVVYDLNNNKTYEIWDVDSDLFSILPNGDIPKVGFYIADIYNIDKNTFKLLYFDNNKKIKILIYDKEKQTIIQDKFLDSDFSFNKYKFDPKFYIKDSNFLILKDRKKDCFEFYKIQYN